jgi:hypothetical protein
MGCVGDDEFARKMAETVAADGVTARYAVDAGAPTGTCAVCIVGGERSLVANLAAANNFKAEHALKPDNWALVEAARVVYSAGFFITVSPESIAAAAKHCAEHDKIYCMVRFCLCLCLWLCFWLWLFLCLGGGIGVCRLGKRRRQNLTPNNLLGFGLLCFGCLGVVGALLLFAREGGTHNQNLTQQTPPSPQKKHPP